MRARLVAERELAVPPASDPAYAGPRCLPDGCWWLRTSDFRVVVLDSDLRGSRHEVELPAEGACTVRPGLGHVAVAGVDRIMLLDRTGSRVTGPRHHRFGAADPSGRSARGPGVVGAVRRLDRLGSVDGRADRGGGTGIAVRESPYEILADIDPRGDRYLTTPVEEDAVTVRRFGDGLVEAVRRGGEVFGDEASFDTRAGYLDPDRVVATAFEGPTVLLTADRLDVIDFVDYPEDAVSRCPEPSGRGTWTTFDPASGRVQLWRL